MKALLTIIFLIFASSILSLGQGADVTIVHSSKGIYIEVERSTLGYNNSIHLGTTASQQLIQGIRKAKDWYTLNQKHHKEFQKEITRFWYMDKTNFQHSGYN